MILWMSILARTGQLLNQAILYALVLECHKDSGAKALMAVCSLLDLGPVRLY